MSKDLIPRVTLAGSRRTFLHRSAVVLGGALLGGPAFAAKQACRLTESEILGPFYRFGAPFFAASSQDLTSPVPGLF